MLSSRALKAGLAALGLFGALSLWSVPAEAGASTGTWRNGMVAGPRGPGYYVPYGRYYGEARPYRYRGYARRSYAPPRYYDGYDGYDGYGYRYPRRWGYSPYGQRSYPYGADPNWESQKGPN